MKHLNLIINIVLAAAVAGLYYLHFHAEIPAAQPAPVTPLSAQQKSSPIVFVNSDTLVDNYEYIKNKKAELEARHKKISAELEAEGQKLQHDAESYRQRGAMMTDEQRAQAEEQLVMRQQQLMQREKSMMAKLDDDQEAINQELFNRISAYLKDFNKGQNFQFILGYQKGGGILYAKDSLDITKQVVEGINKKYKEENK